MRVVPDASAFSKDLKRQLRDWEKSLKVTIPVGFDVDEGELRAKIEAIRVPTIHVPVDIDQPNVPPTVPVHADTDPAQREVDKFVAETKAKRTTIPVKADVDRAAIDRALAGANARMRVDIDRAHFATALRSLLTGIKAPPLQIDVDRDRLLSTFASIGSAASSAFSTASRGISTLISGATSLAEGFKGVGAGLAGVVATVVQVLVVGTALSVVGAAVTAAWATAATAISAAPAALALVGVAAGSVMLGMEGIKKAASALKPEFDRLKTAVSAAFEQGLVPVFNQLKGIFPTLTTGMQDVAGGVVAIAAGLTELVTSGPGIELIRSLLTGVAQSLRDMVPGVANAARAFLTMASNSAALAVIPRLVNAVGEAWQQAVSRLSNTGVLTSAFNQLGTLLESLARGFAGFMEAGVQAFDKMAPGLQTFVDGLGGFFSKFDFGRLGAAVGNVFGGIGKALNSIPQGTVDGLVRAFEQLGQAFQNPALGTTLTLLAEGLTSIVEEIAQFVNIISTVGAGIGSVISTVTGWLGQLQTSSDTVSMALQTAWTAVGTFFSTLWTGIMTAASAVWTAISTAASTAATFVTTAWTAIGTFFTTLWTGVQTAATTVWTWIQTAASTAATAVTTAWTALTAFFTGLWAGIQAGVSAAWTTITTTISTAWSTIQSTVSSAISAVQGALSAAWSAIQSAASAAWEAVKSAVVTAWNGIVSAIKTAISNVVSAVQALPGQITGALGNLGSLLISAGRALIDGLLQGIKAGVQAMLSYVRSIAGQIAAAKGPKPYDKRLLIPQGGWIMGGLLKGLQDGADKLWSWLHRFTNELSGMQIDGPSLAIQDWSKSVDSIKKQVGSSLEVATGGIVGGAVGVGNTFNFVTNNPQAEKASDSIARRARSLAMMGMFG